MMSLTNFAAGVFNVHPAVLFKSAMDRAEIRKSRRGMRQWFERCFVADSFPTESEDFALDLLAGRIRIKSTKLLGHKHAKPSVSDVSE
jgi:hypothetical protein